MFYFSLPAARLITCSLHFYIAFFLLLTPSPLCPPLLIIGLFPAPPMSTSSLPCCVLSHSALLWSYVHPGTADNHQRRKKPPVFICSHSCNSLWSGEWRGKINSIPPFFSPFLHFLSILLPTAGIYWTVKRPVLVWMPHFEFSEHQKCIMSRFWGLDPNK